jgi:hypothetical protein
LTLERPLKGFSGADATGEFDGASAVSRIVVNVDIVPINDLPRIVVPRPTDLIEFSEDSTPQLQTVTGEKGLDIIDADLFECGSV